jgi:hypothetical protein
MKLSDQAGEYVALLHAADKASRPWLYLVGAGWVVCPVLVRTVLLNPSDMIWLQDVLQGVPLPHEFTAQQSAAGEFWAVIALVVLLLVQLVGTTMFYRRSALDMGGPAATPVLWPMAALVPGVLGNAAWLTWTGEFDFLGCLIGLSPAWLTFGGEIVINRLGKTFVYGKTNALVQLHP